MARIDSFLRSMVDQRASDLHICAGARPLVRHEGEISPLPHQVLTRSTARLLLKEIVEPAQWRQFETDLDLDFVYALPGFARFRVNYFMQSRGVGAAFRWIPQIIPSTSELMIPDAVRQFTQLANGLVLVTGPTGSGKTTTLASLIQDINNTRRSHIITIEDPIEYVHEPVLSLVTHRQVGVHIASFEEGLRSALREAPSVLVIGEMRDVETIQLAIRAAETGILVFATLHTNSAPKAVDRIVESFAGNAQEQIRGSLAQVLRGIVAQQLVRRADAQGRIGVHEVLVQSISTARMIRDHKEHLLGGYLETGGDAGSGCQSLDRCLAFHVSNGTITQDEALRVSDRPDLLQDHLLQLPEIDDDHFFDLPDSA